LNTAGLYLHTLRHLKSSQILARLWSKTYRPGANLRPAPQRAPVPGTYVEPVHPAPTLLSANTFCFLGVAGRCATPADWQPAGAEKLWTYNLHYFDDLNAQDAPARAPWHIQLLERWVAENPPGASDGWEPYPTSRRIVNWVKWSLRGFVLSARCHHSLAVQTRWLADRLEYHLLGNHLFMNAKALLYAGYFFSGPEGERWRAKAGEILARELPEQILGDGAQFELSTMYHAAALEDMLDLINLQRAYGGHVPHAWLDIAQRMRAWLEAMTHPDGEIGFFNDSAFGIAPTYAALEAYAMRLCLDVAQRSSDSLRVLESSGYVRACAGPIVLLCDCAAIGPDHLPAHAHADTLSFELSAFGSRILVNSGTSLYGVSTERQRQRGTAAHNTVVVDEENSSEVWSGFRVARRAKVTMRAAVSGPPIVIDASHDGYRRLPGHNEHRRRWSLAESSLRIDDEISGPFKRAQAYFHLHPDIEADLTRPNVAELSLASGPRVTVAFEGAASVVVRESSWHPRFGVSVPNRCIVATLANSRLGTSVTWSPVR
jgi:uncharacterized heparinase superfamily protein